MNRSGQPTMPMDIPGAWITADQTITPAGQVFSPPIVPACQTGTHRQCVDWLAGRHLRQLVTYQAAERYWAFQGTKQRSSSSSRPPCQGSAPGGPAAAG